MHVWVTGADGFVGRALVRRLLATGVPGAPALTRLTAIDQRFGEPAVDPRLVRLAGDFADPALLAEASTVPPDGVFHLASVPGSRAEHEPALGLRVNLLAPIAVFEHLVAPQRPPRVVLASSVAVYGALPGTGAVDESAPTRPALSYGAHKRMTELLLDDLTRRRELDGVSLRLPGIVARPLSPTGHGSAFMSDVIRRLLAGEAFTCPVGAAASVWWMSLACCVDNLLHAAGAAPFAWAETPTVQLPVLTATLGELVAATESLTGRAARIDWRPDARTESLFGRQPRLETPVARRLGFTDDGDLERLVRRALDPFPVLPPTQGTP